MNKLIAQFKAEISQLKATCEAKELVSIALVTLFLPPIGFLWIAKRLAFGQSKP